MQTTQAQYLLFLRNIVGVPVLALPDDSPYIPYSYQIALATVNTAFQSFSQGDLIWVDMVYNLAADTLFNLAQDQSGQTYFTTKQVQWNLNALVPGVISATGDVTTHTTLLNPDLFKSLTFSQLRNLKTPYGRQYLSMAQSYGSVSLSVMA